MPVPARGVGGAQGYAVSRDGVGAPCCYLSGKGYDTPAAWVETVTRLVPRDPGAFESAPSPGVWLSSFPFKQA